MFEPYTFVDTSAWYALLDKSDENHQSAKALFNSSDSPFITSNFIIGETLTLVKNRLGHPIAIEIGSKLWNEEVAKLITIDSKIEKVAWEIFQKYMDKGFSFTDCTSFSLMEQLKIVSAFTFDEHFSQYGKFSVVPPMKSSKRIQ